MHKENFRILIVDDEKSFLLLLSKILEDAGYAVKGFTDPEEAVKAVDSFLPDSAAFPAVVRNPNDAFTKALIYVYDNNLTSITTGGICGRKTTGITVGTTPNVAFVVISGSDDYTIDTTLNGTLNGSPINGVITGSGYITGTITVNDNDIIKWITLDELRIKAGCQGAQLKILNNELPYGFQNSPYSSVTIFADGGVPFTGVGKYRWCVNGTLPSGLYLCPSNVLEATNCLSVDESNWERSDTTTFGNSTCTGNGTPTSSGTFNLTFFVRDDNDQSGNNDNIAQKTLVLTINPAAVTGCSAYRVWNNIGSTYDFMVDGNCRNNIVNGGEITEQGSNLLLNSGETIDRYLQFGTCWVSAGASLTYNQAVTADTDGDCCVNFNGTDRTCP